MAAPSSYELPSPFPRFSYPFWVVGRRANPALTSNARRHKRGQKVETGGLMPDSNKLVSGKPEAIHPACY